MKIGYPCINRSVGCTANHTFRLSSYSQKKIIDTVNSNLDCLEKILDFNLSNQLLFFRISSDVIPFASHPVCKFSWQDYFKPRLARIGNFIKKYKMRISMHPDQFVLINSPREDVWQRSLAELEYHQQFLDLLGLRQDAKIQIHVGGVYGDKAASIKRFIERYRKLNNNIKKRLVIENDHRLYSVADCSVIYQNTGVPIILDSFHHQCLNNGEAIAEVLKKTKISWSRDDGVPMVDYSQQQKNATVGRHAIDLDKEIFKKFLKESHGFDFDIMLEIKNKERSALKALDIIKSLKK
jgi:UV DNA damage endonuclease